MTNWNAQIPVGWAGKDGLLYDREEEISAIYSQPEVRNATVVDFLRQQWRICKCGCGGLPPKRGDEYLSYIPGHNRQAHWRSRKVS